MNDFERRRLKERAIAAYKAPAPTLTTEYMLRLMAGRAYEAEEGDGNDLTVDEFEDYFIDALRERAAGVFHDGLEGVEHPTAHALQVGIASVRHGKPSETFLALLDLIAEQAKTTDILSRLFPQVFPVVRVNSFAQAQRFESVVRRFKAHVRRELEKPRRYIRGSPVAHTFDGLVESFKQVECDTGSLAADEAARQDVRRALFESAAGADIRLWRDRINSTSKSS